MEKPYYNCLLDSFFTTLGVSKNISYEDLRKTYKQLAFKYHPDKNPDNKEAEEKMKEINEIYEILKSDEARKAYVSKFGVSNEPDIFIEQPISSKKEKLLLLKQYLKKLQHDYIEAYKSVRTEEKKYTIKDRFKKIYNQFEDEDYFDTFNSRLASEGLKITCFLGLELLYQLKKLKTEKLDTIPKYTVRNRKTLAGLLVAIMFFNPLSTEAASDQQSPSIDTTTQQKYLLPENINRLTRMYTVQEGDTLSTIATQANTTEEKIIEINRLYSTDITSGQKLKIPYYITDDDLKYYTINVNSSEYENLQDLADAYQTDLRTIYSLNTECFAKINDKYYQISDNLLIPTFPTKEELAKLKESNPYQKS